MNLFDGILSVLMVVCLMWLAFNLGVNYGADITLCVVSDMQTDIPPEENEYCEDALKANPVFLKARQIWVDLAQ